MSLHNWIDERNHLTQLLYDSSYDLVLYIERAIAYGELGYHDLATADAYRALLLCDEVEDEAEEYHSQAEEQLKTHLAHFQEHDRLDYFMRCPCLRAAPVVDGSASTGGGHEKSVGRSTEDWEDDGDADNSCGGLWQMLKQKTFQCYVILISSLCECGCLKSALEYCQRGLAAHPGSEHLEKFQRQILNSAARHSTSDASSSSSDMNFKDQLPDEGFARRDLYPWNTHEPDRSSTETLQFLNHELSKIAPKCEVRTTDLPVLTTANTSPPSSSTSRQLGLFAKADIALDEVLLREKSVLTASNLLQDSICDACAGRLPSSPIPCSGCTDTLFCSAECHSLAQRLYHPASCATDTLDSFIGRDIPAAEASQALYVLLLARVFTMAITQDVHPLDLKELKYTWGDLVHAGADLVTQEDRRLAFSLATTITTPLHILRALDVNIYTSLSTLSDTWIIQTIYAKLRATASARISPSSRSSLTTIMAVNVPNTAAVHPLWCLANHDCDPNVRWEWKDGDGGEMVFWARNRRDTISHAAVDDDDDIDQEGGEQHGSDDDVMIKKGQEIKSHYCDVTLPWRQRREWMLGCLGGWCRCRRCVLEEQEECRSDVGRV